MTRYPWMKMVITYQGYTPYTFNISLCAKHDEEDHGQVSVSHGQHMGCCDVCDASLNEGDSRR